MDETLLMESRILIVDDQPDNVHLLERMLTRRGFTQLQSITDPQEFFPVLTNSEPDLVLLDLQMPVIDGFEILQRLGETLPTDAYLPVLVLTANISPEAKEAALAMGAKDFLHKPFESTEVILRIRNLLHTRHLHRRLQQQNHELEERVRERTQELEEAKLETLRRLARAAEFRDDDTGNHQQRVGESAALIARQLGLPEDQVEGIRLAAPLHDVGKIGIPDGILLKPGRLTPEEFTMMQTHTIMGARLLSGSQFGVLNMAEHVALSHHERWDGSGYPNGLAGEAIPLVGRIVAVADVFDALTHPRAYKPAWTLAQAVAEIDLESGRHFDPAVVQTFRTLIQEGRLPLAE